METYGRKRIFVDRSSFAPAQRLQVLLDTVARARTVLACIGPDWSGRVAKEEDWVRNELVAAIDNRVTILPFVVAPSSPTREQVPAALHSILDVNAVGHYGRDWDSILTDLNVACDRLLGVTRMLPS